MGLLDGFERFGFSKDGKFDITADEPKKDTTATKEETVAAPTMVTEADFIVDKKIKCPVCDKEMTIKSVLTSKIKRLEPDFDLRPNYQGIDTIKYDPISCPNCGYSAMTANFAKIEPARIKLIKQEICDEFIPQRVEAKSTVSYDDAIERMKMALVCTMAKKGKMSEKAYCCLKIAWLNRAKGDKLKKLSANVETIQACEEEYKAFYEQAYMGFLKAMETETPPYNGIASNTLEYMLCNMAVYLGHYDTASKLVAKLLTSPNTPANLKDKCLDLKGKIQEAMRAN